MVMSASYPPVVTLVLIYLFVENEPGRVPRICQNDQIVLEDWDGNGQVGVQRKMKKPGQARLLIRCRQLTVVACIHEVARVGSSNQSATVVSWHLRDVDTKLVTPEVSQIIEAASWLCKWRCRRWS
jgi:hypothetical protein